MLRKKGNRGLLLFAVALVFGGGVVASVAAWSQERADARVVRMAEIGIDPAQREAYLAALREEIDASVRLEPGVLALNAVTVKGAPDQVRLIEVYASDAAYQSHLRSAHFLKYKRETAGMVRSLKLVETEPVMLRSK